MCSFLCFVGLIRFAFLINYQLLLPGVQRQRKLKRSGMLLRNRQMLLESIGFVWTVQEEQQNGQWNSTFIRLAQYHQKHGHCLVPQRYSEDRQLGQCKFVESLELLCIWNISIAIVIM